MKMKQFTIRRPRSLREKPKTLIYPAPWNSLVTIVQSTAITDSLLEPSCARLPEPEIAQPVKAMKRDLNRFKVGVIISLLLACTFVIGVLVLAESQSL